jgi:Domain of unknown function (DUF1918)
MPAKKAPAKKATAKNVKVAKTARKAPAKASSGHSATPSREASSSAVRARPGDLIVLDSPHVGSPAREGEILNVRVGEFSVRYQVRWGDGSETIISPGPGAARIVHT